MVIHDLVRIHLPMERIHRRVLGDDLTGWTTLLECATGEANGRARLRIGLHRDRSVLTKRLHVELTPPSVRAGEVAAGFTAPFSGLRTIFPGVAKTTKMSAAGANATHLAVDGRYKWRLGSLDQRGDRTMIHRIAEGALHGLVLDVGTRIGSDEGRRPDNSRAQAGHHSSREATPLPATSAQERLA